MEITGETKNQLSEIIKEKEIKTLFQPIVNLKNGTIFGYGTTNRITLKKCTFGISEAYEIARKTKRLLDFEILCRKNTVKSAAGKPQNTKLFINFDPNVIREDGYKVGVTMEKLEKNELDYGDIVFEAAEKWAVDDIKLYKDAFNNYRSQGFAVAISGVRSGYSGINRILEINPQYIRIDAEIVNNIENDEMKRSYAAALSQFAKDLGVPLIAVGTETAEQLKTLIELKIDYAQGTYFAKPSEKFEKLKPEIKKEIIRLANELDKPRFASSCRSTVGELCSKKPVISPNALFMEAYEIMNDPNVTEIAIVDGGGLLLGVLNRRQVLNALSGMYGYTLNMRKTVKNVMDTSCLTVSGDTPIETAAKMAMSRPQQSIYDSMPVVNGTTNQYLGFVSIKDLLLTAVNIQVSRAKNCNPLTELPGNIEIDERVERLIGNDEPFAIIYFDLDNFKAYNDAYGFANGDMMIKAVAETLTEYCREEDFCGHVGGDDFVVITAGDRAESFCGEAFARFAERCLELYSESDRERGYIVSRNRSGAVENFPLASLSAAAITNRERSFTSPEELSLIIAKTKKLAKQKTGNSLVIV